MVEGTQIAHRLRRPRWQQDETLVPVSWDEFFRVFDERGLEFLYQEHTHDGHISRFNRRRQVCAVARTGRSLLVTIDARSEPTRRSFSDLRQNMASIPSTMRAAALDGFGDPEVLTIHVLPVPIPDAQEVLIAVHTAGVGSWDADMRAGWWPEGRPKFPLVLGTDGSGTVVEVGASARRLKVGDRVYSYSFANPKGGFYAEYVAVASENASGVPKNLGMKEAGAAATTGLTALQGIDDVLRLKRGEIVIIHGATGGVGSLAVQFAKLRGATVLATARGEDGLLLARRLGAVEAIDTRHDDIAAAAHKFSRRGVDAILATAGGEALERAIDVVRQGGRVAYPNGVEPEPKRRSGIEIVAYDAVPGVHQFEQLNEAIERANLIVPIAAEYPLAEAAKAHERLAAGHLLGKIVLRVQPD